ncbi:MAG: hypothetical protein WD889_02235, partial [Candidatus Colwellbacteria bacterium]
EFFWQGKLIYPLYHPAAALRSTAVLENLKKSFERLPELVKNFDKLLAERRASSPPVPKADQTKLF